MSGNKLNIIVKWNMDENYFKIFWADLLKSKVTGCHKLRPYGIIVLVIGVLLYLLISESFLATIVGAGCLLVALRCFVFFYLAKRAWFKNNMIAKKMNGVHELHFLDDKILSFSPMMKGEMLWETIDDVIDVSEGVIFILQKNLYIYVLNSSFPNQRDKGDILNHFVHIQKSKTS